jgi:hypothetical protein
MAIGLLVLAVLQTLDLVHRSRCRLGRNDDVD